MRRPATLAGGLALPAALLAAGCGDAGDNAVPASEATMVPYAPAPTEPRPVPPQVGDFAELSSKDCVEVVRFYFEALGNHEYDKAALVWNDPMIDGARLRTLFSGYEEPLFEWTAPFVEASGRSLFCTAGGTLFDAKDSARPIVQGQLELRRVDDVPGATPAELRWTLRSSTFVEQLRSAGS
jgi:hypothetical protein